MTQHSYIKSVELKEYKSIKGLVCDFLPGLNIIIGDNGSGKSNFFEFIDKCISRKYNGLGNFYANIRFQEYEGTTESLSELVWESETRTQNETLERIEDLVKPEHKVKEPSNSTLFSLSYIKFSIPEDISILQKEYNPTYKIGESELIDRDNYPESLPGFLKYLIAFSFPDRELKTLKEFTDTGVFKSLNSFFEKVSWKFKDNVARYSPVEDIRLSNSFRIAKLSTDTFEFRNIVLEYKINGDWFSWSALSDGTKRGIYIISEVIGTNLDWLFNREGVDLNLLSVVFLEEPEIGVHPHQLHQLLQFLKEQSETHQIFVTTHSPQVLDVLSAGELNRLVIAEIASEQGTTFRHLNEEERSKAEVYLKDDGMLSDYWRFSDFQRTK